MKDFFKYRNKKPEANNSRPPISTFFHRKIYENLERVRDEQKMIINLWEQKLLYGRENEYGNRSVFPKEEFLKVVLPGETEDTVKLINFVADAFEDFRVFWLERSGCSDESNFKDLVPTAGWQNVNTLYRVHFEKIYSIFYSQIVLGEKQEKSIVDFISFMRTFQNYSERIANRVSIFRSKFITTRFSSPMISGLAVEISKEDHSKDVDKFEKFIEDPKFTFFKNSAMRYGFFVDKNAPWRLIANIHSPAMKPYLERYGLNSEDLFTEYYYTAEQYDLDIFKTILFNFYNSFVTEYPVFKVPRAGLVERKYLRAEELEQISDKFWFEYLLRIKRIEENSTPYDDDKLRVLLKKALDKKKYVSLSEAIRYINEITKE